jgi:hypothetical protein
LTFPVPILKPAAPPTPKIKIDLTNYERSLRHFVRGLGEEGLRRVKRYLMEITSSSSPLTTLSSELSTQLAKVPSDSLDFSNPLGLTSSDLQALQSLSELGIDTSFINELLQRHHHSNSTTNGIKTETSSSMSMSTSSSLLQQTLDKNADTIYQLQTLQYERTDTQPSDTEIRLGNM